MTPRPASTKSRRGNTSTLSINKPRVPWAQVPGLGLLTTADVARVLRVSARQVRTWAAAGDLVGEETWGGQWVFARRDVEAFWVRTGRRLTPQGVVTSTGQLPLPLAAARGDRTPEPWTWARFRPRMAKVPDPDPEANRGRKTRKTTHVA